jgi:hypothetical protein
MFGSASQYETITRVRSLEARPILRLGGLAYVALRTLELSAQEVVSGGPNRKDGC